MLRLGVGVGRGAVLSAELWAGQGVRLTAAKGSVRFVTLQLT